MSGNQIPILFFSHWLLAPVPDALALCAAALYLIGARRVRGWSPWRIVWFAAGVGVALVAVQSGIGAYDDTLLSDHMVQHLLLLELAPLLMLAGRPLTLILRAAPRARRPALARRVRGLHRALHPLTCLAILWVVIAGTHLPGFYDATLRHPLLHDAEHGLYVLTGLLMWWPVLDEDPVVSHRLSGALRLLYLTGAMLPMTIVGAYLSSDPTLLYTPYAAPAHALGISAVVDQQQAGAIMWVLGSSLMVVCGIWQAMASLIAEERRMQSQERRADAMLERVVGRS
ncbi:MAG TPA: cytochrome c oxidase assembly protein [Solirubrobacteraceae bacterium]|nr:cytochrome c oxidase assembly protein [Solirubrobacteraceae bacterium]